MGPVDRILDVGLWAYSSEVSAKLIPFSHLSEHVKSAQDLRQQLFSNRDYSHSTVSSPEAILRYRHRLSLAARVLEVQLREAPLRVGDGDDQVGWVRDPDHLERGPGSVLVHESTVFPSAPSRAGVRISAQVTVRLRIHVSTRRFGRHCFAAYRIAWQHIKYIQALYSYCCVCMYVQIDSVCIYVPQSPSVLCKRKRDVNRQCTV